LTSTNTPVSQNIVTLLDTIIPRQRGGITGFVLATVLVVTALLIRLAIAPVEAGLPFLTFFPAVTLAAILAGFFPAIIALVTCSFLASYLFIPPYYSLHLSFHFATFWSNSVFYIEELLVIFVVEGMYLHRQKEELSTSALKVEKTQLQLMVDNVSGFATLLLDTQGRVSSWNKGAQRLKGYAAEDVIGKSFEIFFTPEDIATGTPQSILDLAMQAGVHESVGWRVRKDGSRFYADMVISPLSDDQGKVTGFVKMTRDISDQHRYEQRLNTIIRSAPVPLIMANSKGEIVLMNVQAESLFQYSKEELVGKTIEELIPQQFRNAHIHHRESFMEIPVSRAMSSGRTLFGKRKNGEEFPIEVGLGAMHDQDEYLVLAAVIDVSDRKQMEALLVNAKTKSDEASLAKGEFLANMSHEIRTPMNAIIGLTQLTLDSTLDSKQRDHLQKVYRSSRALLGILDDILDYSKIEAGKLNLEMMEFSLEDVVKNVGDLFSAKIAEQGLELFIEIDRNIEFQLIGDPLRLNQVLNNIVGNAIKFTERGEIHIKVKIIGNENGKITLQFAIKDTGIGMDKVQADRLFSAFTQADTSITRKYGGTGLGLSISKRLVELMGGKISVSSTPNSGSTFTFTALFGQGGKIAKPNRQEIQAMRALVVDDQETSLEVLEHYLQTWNFDVTGTTSAEDAIELIELADRDGHPYEMLIVDWKMPGMNGLELTRLVEKEVKQGRLKHAPIIIMVTAHDREALFKEAGSVSLDGVLVKPVTPSDLFDNLLRIQKPHLANQIRAQEAKVGLYELAAPIRGARILLVEDNDINQEVAMEFLSKAGLVTILANHGGEAVELVKNENFDAVLMDVQMPVMDGLEATRLIRNMPQGKDLPIFALSAAAMTQDIQASLQAGMNGHISKPFDAEQLIATLLKWVNGRSPVGSAKRSAATVEPEQLPRQLPGFDLTNALARVHGNQAMLSKLLKRFANDYASTSSQVDSLLIENRTEEAARVLHGFKGVCLILGAKGLAETVQHLENQIKAGEALQSQAIFAQQLEETVFIIQHHLS